MHGTRRSFRLAAVASLALHAALVGGIVLVNEFAIPASAISQPDIDTRVSGESRITMRFTDAEIAVSPTPSTSASAPQPIEGSRPEVRPAPRLLPSSVIERVHQAMAKEPAEVQAVSATIPERVPVLAGGQPVHGALQHGQTIVYVLDASGSMGQAGKFDRARRALLATLREQPDDVRFQVIVYAGAARGLMPGCVPASSENIERTANWLSGIEPVGQSAHADALKLAGHANPEFVLIFTDGDDLPTDAVRTLSLRLARPAALSIVVVRNDGLDSPRPWSGRGFAP